MAEPILSDPESVDIPLPSLSGKWESVSRLLEAEVYESYLPTVERHVRMQIARGVDGIAHHILRSVVADGSRKEKQVRDIVTAARPFVLDVLRSASRLRVRRPTRSGAPVVDFLQKPTVRTTF